MCFVTINYLPWTKKGFGIEDMLQCWSQYDKCEWTIDMGLYGVTNTASPT